MIHNNYDKLYNAAKDGDNVSLQFLINYHLNKTIGSIQKQFSFSLVDLEDIKQLTSIEAFNKIHQSKSYEGFNSWIYNICYNKSLLFISKANKIKSFEVSLENLSEDEDDNSVNYLNNLEDTLQETALIFLDKKEEINAYKQIVSNLLEKISEKHRSVLDLVVLQEKSYKETANILQIPVGSVMSRFFYAKQEAKTIIKRYVRQNNYSEFFNLG